MACFCFVFSRSETTVYKSVCPSVGPSVCLYCFSNAFAFTPTRSSSDLCRVYGRVVTETCCKFVYSSNISWYCWLGLLVNNKVKITVSFQEWYCCTLGYRKIYISQSYMSTL